MPWNSLVREAGRPRFLIGARGLCIATRKSPYIAGAVGAAAAFFRRAGFLFAFRAGFFAAFFATFRFAVLRFAGLRAVFFAALRAGLRAAALRTVDFFAAFLRGFLFAVIGIEMTPSQVRAKGQVRPKTPKI